MIRKALVLLTAGLVAIAVPAGASAVYSLLDFNSAVDAMLKVDPTLDPPPNDPGRDLAVGGFQAPVNNNVGFSAHSGPLGEDSQGHLSETIRGTFQGRFRVTCLIVVGTEAGIGLVPTRAASNDIEDGFVLGVRDNRLLGTPDEFAFVPGVLAEDCVEGLGAAAFPIDRGNILVHDALP